MTARTTPVPVMVAGTAIIGIRLLDILLLLAELGLSGVSALLATHTQSWDAALIFFASVLLLLITVTSGAAILRGHNWGRWLFAASQGVVASYMLFSSLGWFPPYLFVIEGESNGEILHHLLLQKIPDVLVLYLLFIPASSRRYFLHPRSW